MNPIKGGKSVVSYDAYACDAYNWDYELHWSDGSTTRNVLSQTIAGLNYISSFS
ncbi:MAG: hypothetical protein QM654_16220 [Dysgonamonadaceae bacterium]